MIRRKAGGGLPSRAAQRQNPQRELRRTRRRQGDTKIGSWFQYRPWVGGGTGPGRLLVVEATFTRLVDSSCGSGASVVPAGRPRGARVALVDVRAQSAVQQPPPGYLPQAGQRRAQPSRDRRGRPVDRVHHGWLRGPPRMGQLPRGPPRSSASRTRTPAHGRGREATSRSRLREGQSPSPELERDRKRVLSTDRLHRRRSGELGQASRARRRSAPLTCRTGDKARPRPLRPPRFRACFGVSATPRLNIDRHQLTTRRTGNWKRSSRPPTCANSFTQDAEPSKRCEESASRSDEERYSASSARTEQERRSRGGD